MKMYGDQTKETLERIKFFYTINTKLHSSLASGKWLCHKCRNEIDRYFESIHDNESKKISEKFSKLVVVQSVHDSVGEKRRAERSDDIDSTPRKDRSCHGI